MIFKMIKLIFVFCFLITSAFSEIVNNITINGNKRISSESIKVLGNISTQKNLEKKDLNNLLKKLYDTNFFKDVNLSLDKGNLIINVIENPIIENIEIIRLAGQCPALNVPAECLHAG